MDDHHRYRVTTWDIDRQDYTPQQGVRAGPYTLMGLRRALRQLRALGLETKRFSGFSVLVERVDAGYVKEFAASVKASIEAGKLLMEKHRHA